MNGPPHVSPQLLCTYKCTQACTGVHIIIGTCMYTNTHADVYTYAHTHRGTYTHACTHTYTQYVCLNSHTYVHTQGSHVSTCTCTHIHIQTCSRTRTHVHVYTQILSHTTHTSHTHMHTHAYTLGLLIQAVYGDLLLCPRRQVQWYVVCLPEPFHQHSLTNTVSRHIWLCMHMHAYACIYEIPSSLVM